MRAGAERGDLVMKFKYLIVSSGPPRRLAFLAALVSHSCLQSVDGEKDSEAAFLLHLWVRGHNVNGYVLFSHSPLLTRM